MDAVFDEHPQLAEYAERVVAHAVTAAEGATA
jgi:hypothetical protein